MTHFNTILAQTPPFFLNMNNLFWATILLIFLITILSAVIRRLAKDKTLKLFHKYHVSFFSETRSTTWGDLWVLSQGIELLFDQPRITRRNLTKSSALVYDDEFPAMICLSRSIHGLTKLELQHRQQQIHRTFHPNLFHRTSRWLRNLLNTLRDAISKTMSLVIGRFTGGVGAGAVLSTQATDITNLTGSVLNLAANAYEPILERYIGKPVILEIAIPQLPGSSPPPPGMANTVEFPGYLVDYTQRFIAVFNVDHTPIETFDITLDPHNPSIPPLPDLLFTQTPTHTLISCIGRDAFILRKLCCGKNTSDLGIAMVPGSTLLLDPIENTTTLTVERTRNLDLIVPRTRARIHFGSLPASHRKHLPRLHWSGLAPKVDSHDIPSTLPKQSPPQN